MADLTSANYVFLPWVRQGAASGIQTPDSLSANQAGFVSVPVKLRVNDTDLPEQQVRLYGPGDVTGIDPLQVIRTEPRHLATDFEPNYFPAVEFDRPDFPWLFTPAKADAAGKLRPWLCSGCRAETGRRHAARRSQSAAAGPRNQGAARDVNCRICQNRGRGRTRRLPAPNLSFFSRPQQSGTLLP